MRTIRTEIQAAAQGWLERHNIELLRVSMGAVIFGFGVLKYLPGVSPAQDLVLADNHLLTFGLLPDTVTLVLFATVECIIGLSLITGWGLHLSIYPLTVGGGYPLTARAAARPTLQRPGSRPHTGRPVRPQRRHPPRRSPGNRHKCAP